VPRVFVHGVPETERLWDGLRGRLKGDDSVALSLPGFGRPLPENFAATMDQYAEWLIGQLEGIDGPVDLVGHDWGGGFTLRAVSLRPDLVRSWVTDAAGLADVDFEWHAVAQIWQTEGDGEAFMDGQLAMSIEDRVDMSVSLGIPADTAHAFAEALDRTMADSILSLYRSATKVREVWGPDFADIPKPGLVVIPLADPFLSETGARRAGQRAGARIAPLEGLGHWWMLGDPDRAADLLQDFWASVP
jgi:pimeloyl-ACP methyl ester carboxylesterase